MLHRFSRLAKLTQRVTEQGLRTLLTGKKGGGRVSFGPINLTAIIKDESMKAIFDGVTVRDWIVGLGDGTAQPTLSGGVITMFNTRSWHYFDAIITSESHDAIAPNEVLRGSYEGIVANYADYSIKSEDDDTTITSAMADKHSMANRYLLEITVATNTTIQAINNAVPNKGLDTPHPEEPTRKLLNAILRLFARRLESLERRRDHKVANRARFLATVKRRLLVKMRLLITLSNLSFLQLADTPYVYAGSIGKFVRVNARRRGWNFFDLARRNRNSFNIGQARFWQHSTRWCCCLILQRPPLAT